MILPVLLEKVVLSLWRIIIGCLMWGFFSIGMGGV